MGRERVSLEHWVRQHLDVLVTLVAIAGILVVAVLSFAFAHSIHADTLYKDCERGSEWCRQRWLVSRSVLELAAVLEIAVVAASVVAVLRDRVRLALRVTWVTFGVSFLLLLVFFFYAVTAAEPG